MREIRERGITLIALVVTIVVLLILAGITIGAITGDNGIINKTGQAKEDAEIANEKEIVEEATVAAMAKNKSGEIEESDLQSELDRLTEKDKTNVSIIRKKYIVEFTDSKRMYQVDNDGNVYEYVYTELPIMESGLDFSSRMKEYKSNIINIRVVNYVEIPDNAIKSFDVSKDQNGSVMAWLIVNEKNTEYYDLYIGGYDGVQAPESCQNMFADMINAINIDLEDFYTEKTKNLGYMFLNCKSLEEINLSNMNTSEVTFMGSVFAGCSNLKELDINHFDTSKVGIMSSLFSGCSSIKNLDLNNFDTSKVIDMNYMFYRTGIEVLDISSFDTSQVTNMSYMFANNSNLKTIYVSDKWNVDKVNISTKMFANAVNIVGAIKYDITKLDVTYANYENGYFTYKEK